MTRFGKMWIRLSNVLLTAMIILSVGLVGLHLAGFRAYTVLSGSMEPEIPTGAMIFVRPVGPEALKTGDVITFLLNAETTATHRIVRIVPEEEGYRFYTKGDANAQPDGASVHSGNIIGVPVLLVPGMGFAVAYLQSRAGIFLIITVGAVAMLQLMIPDAANKKRRTEGESI